MSDDEIEAFADLIHDAAIQYANGRETDFRPVARQIAEASRRSALEEAAQAAHGYSLQAERIIRALAKETNNG